MTTPGTKLLILDAYPLHKEMHSILSEYDTHVLFVPSGLTWALQPLDAGFFKATKDELKRIWANNQQTSTSNETEKRNAISSALKETLWVMEDKDNSGYWRKAGLEYPHDILQVPRIRNQGEMELEGSVGGGMRNEASMMIEDEW